MSVVDVAGFATSPGPHLGLSEALVAGRTQSGSAHCDEPTVAVRLEAQA